MKSEKVEKFLTEKGYKFYPNGLGDADYVVGNYYKVMYGFEDVPDCLCNDKPPQIGIRETYLHLPQMPVPIHSFSIGFTNQAPQEWADFKFYGFSEDDLIEKYNYFEVSLLNAWRSLFETVNI